MDNLSQNDKVILDTIFDPLQPLGVSSDPGETLNEATDAENDPALSTEAAELLKQAIISSEKDKFDEALVLFGQALDKAPRSASILNDRAQCLRLAGKNQKALEDLTLAVEYSDGKGRTGVQALCQRAALYRYLGNDEEAKKDFEKAAQGGSNYAKSQLVAMNPYAAMCNAMLHKITVNLGK